MPGPLAPYEVDPLTTTLYALDALGNRGDATTLGELTGGRYDLVAGGSVWAIRDMSTGQFVGSLGQQGPARFLFQPGDFFQYTYGTLAGAAQAQLARGGQIALSGTTDVFLPSGNTYSVDVSSAILTGENTTWYSHVTSKGEIELIPFDLGTTLQQAVNKVNIPDLYPTTLRELADRSIMQDLQRNHEQEVKQIADTEFGGPGKSSGQAFYDALVWLASTATLQALQFAVSHTVNL